MDLTIWSYPHVQKFSTNQSHLSYQNWWIFTPIFIEFMNTEFLLYIKSGHSLLRGTTDSPWLYSQFCCHLKRQLRGNLIIVRIDLGGGKYKYKRRDKEKAIEDVCRVIKYRFTPSSKTLFVTKFGLIYKSQLENFSTRLKELDLAQP